MLIAPAMSIAVKTVDTVCKITFFRSKAIWAFIQDRSIGPDRINIIGPKHLLCKIKTTESREITRYNEIVNGLINDH
jgi:hypothetical protein